MQPGGLFTILTTNNVRKWIVSFVAVSSSIYWIGLSDLVESEFRWTIDQEVASYKNFADGQPNNSGGNQDCIYFNSVTGTWEDAPCGNGYKYICENDICKWVLETIETKTHLQLILNDFTFCLLFLSKSCIIRKIVKLYSSCSVSFIYIWWVCLCWLLLSKIKLSNKKKLLYH